MPDDWLDELEEHAWRGLLDCHTRLVDRLDADLQASQGLALADYEVLVILSEAPDHRIRMRELAGRLNLSPSGATRRVDGLVAAGLAERVPCVDDRRGSYATLTDAGERRLRSAAPDHVRHVRRHFLDHVDRQQLAMLAAAFDAVIDAVGQPDPTIAGSDPA